MSSMKSVLVAGGVHVWFLIPLLVQLCVVLDVFPIRICRHSFANILFDCVTGDELAVVWDAESGEVLQVLKGHSGEINSVDVSYKGRFAITGEEHL